MFIRGAVRDLGAVAEEKKKRLGDMLDLALYLFCIDCGCA